MELKFLSVNLNTINSTLNEKQIAKVIELQNNLIKWEIENKKLYPRYPLILPDYSDTIVKYFMSLLILLTIYL